MTTLAAKRMAKERLILETSNSDYFVHFESDNLLAFDAYVIGPTETPYQHKLAHLRFEIPERYPLVPPKVKFIQHTGSRIHPNLYVEGKVCLSILGTWPGEPWAFGMTCHTVLITVRSLLDDKPYKHEPGDRDDPAFTNFVEYASWRSMLIDYLSRAPNEACKDFIARHISENADVMRAALARQAVKNNRLRQFNSPYFRGHSSADLQVRYTAVQADLERVIKEAQAVVGVVLPVKRTLPADETVQNLGQEGGAASLQKRAKVSKGDIGEGKASSHKEARDSNPPAKTTTEAIDLT